MPANNEEEAESSDSESDEINSEQHGNDEVLVNKHNHCKLINPWQHVQVSLDSSAVTHLISYASLLETDSQQQTNQFPNLTQGKYKPNYRYSLLMNL
ncbi:hypothetical protein ACJMK2_015940 [Sinanodonta woodiana]|uniref:Uncharacterized protein n=1 Tax=Sinanodonta woodiana TaxID=1069815 RepID=A0ABD3US02_SINWO